MKVLSTAFGKYGCQILTLGNRRKGNTNLRQNLNLNQKCKMAALCQFSADLCAGIWHKAVLDLSANMNAAIPFPAKLSIVAFASWHFGQLKIRLNGFIPEFSWISAECLFMLLVNQA
jgi:hypothetical protein